MKLWNRYHLARSAEEALECDVRDLAVNVSEKLRPPPVQESDSRSFQSMEGEIKE